MAQKIRRSVILHTFDSALDPRRLPQVLQCASTRTGSSML